MGCNSICWHHLVSNTDKVASILDNKFEYFNEHRCYLILSDSKESDVVFPMSAEKVYTYSFLF